MPDSEAMIGYGSIYSILDSLESPAEWKDIGEVFNITPPSFTSDRVEVTHMQSPNRTREYKPNLVTPGTASLQMNFIPGSESDALLRAHQQQGIVSTHRITFPNDVTWEFSASIETVETEDPVDDRMTATVGVNVSGNITEGTAS